MTTNGASNVEDTDMAECDGEKVVTMMDVLQEEQDFEDDANAVLGASDEKNCTYTKGYIKRQAIYACLTCCSEAKVDPTKRAGVCLACSLNCHENHDLVELYTKRNFRCDCGNPKFNSHPCQFTPNKPDLNEDNTYNQNFGGLYCICHRPYPDPESTVEDDEMIQCIICEDWLHASHLEAAVPGVEQYAEMVCKACMENNEFLHDYNHLIVNNETEDGDVTGINGNDTTLTNGDLNDMLGNGIDVSMNAVDKPESINGIEDPVDNMNVDDAQNEKTSDNDDMATQLEESLNKEYSDVTMEAEPENVNTAQLPSASSTESPENTTEFSSEEKTMSTERLDGTQEKSNINSEDKTEMLTKCDDASAAEASDEPKDTSLGDDSEKMKEKTDQDIELQHPEKSAEIKDAVGTEESKSDEEAASTESKADESSNINSNETSNGEETSAIKDSNDTEATSVEIDKSGKSETPTEPSKQDDENKTEITEKGGAQSETNAEIESTKDEDECNITSKIDEDDAMKEYIHEPTENSEETVENVCEPPENTEETVENVLEPSNNSEETVKNVCEPSENTEETVENVLEPCNNSEETVENKTEEIKDKKRKLSTEDSSETTDPVSKKHKTNEESNCIRPKGVKRVHKGATFWPSNFRQKLCTCSECLSMYKDLSVLFLIDAEDTVFAYEALGKERVDGRTTQYEKGLEALSSLDRIQQINALTEYNKMKDKLLDFLKSFKDRKEVVKEDDIKAFFAGMKPKREPDGVYFCR